MWMLATFAQQRASDARFGQKRASDPYNSGRSRTRSGRTACSDATTVLNNTLSLNQRKRTAFISDSFVVQKGMDIIGGGDSETASSARRPCVPA